MFTETCGDKMVELIIPLFYKPAWELDLEGKELDVKFADELRNLGDELRDRLYRAAELHEKLLENGWKAIGGQYEITYTKDLTIEEAQQEIQKLQIEKYLSSITKS